MNNNQFKEGDIIKLKDLVRCPVGGEDEDAFVPGASYLIKKIDGNETDYDYEIEGIEEDLYPEDGWLGSWINKSFELVTPAKITNWKERILGDNCDK